MKNCPKCNKEHMKPGIYCSRSCANSRVWSQEDKIKKSTSAKNSEKVKKANKHKKFPEWVNEQYKNGEYLNNTPFDNLGMDYKRKFIEKEQNNRCIKCGIYEWLGKPIVFELDQIDGDRNNNCRENLELLCPNCHSQTHTWRGRNKARNRVSDETLKHALSNAQNIRQALHSVGIAPKGGNYKRAKRLLEEIEEQRTSTQVDKGN